MTGTEADAPLVTADKADHGNGDRRPMIRPRHRSRRRGLSHYRGVLLGAASTVGAVLDSIADTHKAFVIDFAAVPFLDSTAANAMAGSRPRRGARSDCSSPARRRRCGARC